MKKKRKKLFTLMLIPHSKGRIRRIKTSKFAFSAIIGALVIAIAALAFFINDYRQMKQKVARLYLLEKITQEQREKILSLNEKVKDFNQTMERLRALEDKLRTLAGIGGESTGVKEGRLGKGGPEHYSFPEEIAPSREYSSSNLIGKIEENFDFLEAQAKEREEGFGQIEEVIYKKKNLFASTPNIFPVQGWITSGYGWRRNPFTGKREFHKAIDISAPWGTPIRAAAKGKIVYAGWDDAYGLKIRISDGYGYYTVYGHLSHILVKRGAWVKKGQIIGRVGSTGRSTGPHLHFEVWRNGKSINPLNLMVEPLG
ncbi:MAG: M23 family metallopeptidase [Candidatus Aerophobetes bacterium]|nr:M23 family metallopeptidase [Candidatus Aerophobetes bacterium]